MTLKGDVPVPSAVKIELTEQDKNLIEELHEKHLDISAMYFSLVDGKTPPTKDTLNAYARAETELGKQTIELEETPTGKAVFFKAFFQYPDDDEDFQAKLQRLNAGFLEDSFWHNRNQDYWKGLALQDCLSPIYSKGETAIPDLAVQEFLNEAGLSKSLSEKLHQEKTAGRTLHGTPPEYWDNRLTHTVNIVEAVCEISGRPLSDLAKKTIEDAKDYLKGLPSPQ